VSGNSHDRRVRRRASQRIWENSPALFQTGETLKITVDHYGVRYADTKVVCVAKGTGYGTYVVQSNRRKSPLIVSQSHLERVA
jgi:hypothetical protein